LENSRGSSKKDDEIRFQETGLTENQHTNIKNFHTLKQPLIRGCDGRKDPFTLTRTIEKLK
jgi:hypothetical protein